MISQTSEYALRAAVFLAARKTNEPATAADVAEGTQVPLGYLQKVLRMLSRKGLLSAHRGTGGGFALARPAQAISVLDVMHASDSPIARISKCPLGIQGHEKLCALHHLLDGEIARTERVFAETSLHDLLEGKSGLRGLCDPSGKLPQSVGVKAPPKTAP